MKTWTISANMIIKASTKLEAEKIVRARIQAALNEWICEEPINPPYPEGALLHYTFAGREEEA